MRDTERAGGSTLRNDGQMGVSGTVQGDGVMSDDIDDAGCWANLKEVRVGGIRVGILCFTGEEGRMEGA